MPSSTKDSSNESPAGLRYKPHPVEISLAKRDLLNFVLQELSKVDGYWRFRYREIIAKGIGISFNSSTDIGEREDGIVITHTLEIFVPREIWEKIAWARKNKMFRFPKPHPVIRQRDREMEEVAEYEEKEISEEISKIESEEEGDEGD